MKMRGQLRQNRLCALRPTPAISSPLSRIVHVPPCTAELTLAPMGKAYYMSNEGGLIFLMPRPAAIYMKIGAANSVLTAHAGTDKSPA
jgi:hypothetical protein